MEEFMAATPYIDKDHPAVVKTTRKIVAGAQSDREKAVRLHDFVRDEIKFGWTRKFYRMRASDVLEAKLGYCNTKATLFIAMLRAAGIPARQRFVDISSGILTGIVSTGNAYLDHSYTEVFLHGDWVGVDSYVLDTRLFLAAQNKLESSGRGFGFGVHKSGSYQWDGVEDSFSQYVTNGGAKVSARDYGIFEDVRDFYDRVQGQDELSGLRRVLIPLFIGSATKNVQRLRDSG